MFSSPILPGYDHKFKIVDREHKPAPIEAYETITRVMGLDLGQQMDPAAAVVLRIREASDTFVGPRYPFIDVSFLQIWDKGTPYDILCDDCFMLWPNILVMDYGGPGRPFYDFLKLRAAELRYPGQVIPIQTVGSNANIRIHNTVRGKYANVPKIEIVTSLNIAQQRRMLRLPDCPETEQLKKELMDFKLLYSRAAQFTFDHRGPGHHGDLVMALGLALYVVLKGGRHLAIF